MKDTTKAALAAGIAGGYVLGRTKRAKIALAVATWVVGRKLRPPRPTDLLPLPGGGGQDGGESRLPLGGMGAKLMEAGRTAAGHQVEALADALHARTQALTDGSAPQAARDEAAEKEPAENEEATEPAAKSAAENGGRRRDRDGGASRPAAGKRGTTAKKAAAAGAGRGRG
jgi:hypothetical protein